MSGLSGICFYLLSRPRFCFRYNLRLRQLLLVRCSERKKKKKDRLVIRREKAAEGREAERIAELGDEGMTEGKFTEQDSMNQNICTRVGLQRKFKN